MRGIVAAAVVLVWPLSAEAHITLELPASWTTENALGDPQKDSPCGGEGGTRSNVVSTFLPGETITVQWRETIYHPGHYRIAFATSRADLRDPIVTVDNNQDAVSATIDDPPVYPVLLDGLFPRTGGGSAGSVFTQDVTLPNMECTGCVLQVIQFMEGHGPPNYIYYHCADIDLVAPPPPDAGFEEDAEPIDLGPPPDAGFDDSGAPVDQGVIDYGVRDTGAYDSGIVDSGVRRDGTVTVPDTGADPILDAGVLARADASGLHGSCACSSAVEGRRGWGGWLLALLLLRRRELSRLFCG
jgi:hypothetical protein